MHRRSDAMMLLLSTKCCILRSSTISTQQHGLNDIENPAMRGEGLQEQGHGLPPQADQGDG
jgi:hypothetical protein